MDTKAGNYIVCIDDSVHGYYGLKDLEKGKKYRITKTACWGDVLCVDGLDIGWAASRFKAAISEIADFED